MNSFFDSHNSASASADPGLPLPYNNLPSNNVADTAECVRNARRLMPDALKKEFSLADQHAAVAMLLQGVPPETVGEIFAVGSTDVIRWRAEFDAGRLGDHVKVNWQLWKMMLPPWPTVIADTPRGEYGFVDALLVVMSQFLALHDLEIQPRANRKKKAAPKKAARPKRPKPRPRSKSSMHRPPQFWG